MNLATTRRRFLAGALIGVSALASIAALKIPMRKLDLWAPRSDGKDGVRVRPVLPGEVKEVTTDLVSILGPGRHTEPSNSDSEVVWLILAAKLVKASDGVSTCFPKLALGSFG